MRFYGFSAGDSSTALGVDLMEILQHDGRIQTAGAELLLNQGQVLTDKIQVKHGSKYFIGKRGGNARSHCVSWRS
jgi:hypothetical protein